MMKNLFYILSLILVASCGKIESKPIPEGCYYDTMEAPTVLLDPLSGNMEIDTIDVPYLVCEEEATITEEELLSEEQEL